MGEKRRFFSRKNTNIFFHILTKCNLSCKHCYIDPVQHGKKILDFKTISLWLEIMFKETKNPNIVFLGGEPTLHPSLPLILKKAREIGYRKIIVDTNGFRVKQVLKKIEKKDVDLFSFSLDGPTRYTNDILRGKGSFDTCLEGLFETKKMGFKVGLIYTVSTENFCYLSEFYKLLEAIDIDFFSIQVIGLRGKTSKFRREEKFLKQVDDIAWKEMIPEVVKKVANMGIVVNYPRVFLMPGENFECAGLFANNYFIFPNGRIYECPLCEDYPLHGKIIKNKYLLYTKGINEKKLFRLNIPEGCIINKLVQSDNIKYYPNGRIKYKIACCMLKEESIF